MNSIEKSMVLDHKLVKQSLRGISSLLGPMRPEDRLRFLFDNYDEDEILITSSFGIKSVLLLELVHKIKKNHPIYFVDTGYHFSETLKYKDKLKEILDLNFQILLPDPVQHQLTTDESWWQEHPRMCCTINKIAPLQPIIDKHTIWISNLMAYETEHRSRLEILQRQGDIIKFHPFLDLDEEEYRANIRQSELPRHPLFLEGYGSIGCTHCTLKGQGRNGRWQGKAKTECGLHLKYFTKESLD